VNVAAGGTGSGVEPDEPAVLLDDDPAELYERAPCAHLSARADGTIVRVNATFTAWTGFRPDDVVGVRRLQDLLPVGSRIFFETHVSPMLRMQGMVREIATELTCADGTELAVVLSAVLERDAAGQPAALRVALFDARERRAYEEELLAARRRAEASEARARTLAETLQASLLPAELLEIPGLDVAGAYRPAGDGYEVGGDFYDVFETGRGTWAVVLGDVCGKGAPAAIITSLARYTVRAEALRTPYPSAVLAALHDALRRNHPDQFCTALFLVVDRKHGAFRVTVAAGGHPLPIRVRRGALEHVGATGTILGMIEEVRVTDRTIELEPGDSLVLYTDGVTEARRNGRFLDEAGLEAVLLDAGDLGATELAEHVVRHVVDFQAGMPRDDIAVVVLHVPAT
jgi:sigma-B regulation protein RsbU (phosphoserine phosphatase)